jgi:hypothetical protein
VTSGGRAPDDWLTERIPVLAEPTWLPTAEQTRAAAGRTVRPDPAPRRAARPRRLSITLVVAAVVLGIGFLVNLGGGARDAATNQSISTTEGTPLDLTRPFAQTPAANWADGSAGLVVPAAGPLGGHSATAVADALTEVRAALVAAHLDDRMLINHDLSTYLALLAPAIRDRERAALTGTALARDGGEVTLLAGGFTLLPVPAKVSGSMTVSTDRYGQLVVSANYVFAYPFAPADSSKITSAWQVVAIQHVSEDFTVVDSADADDYSPGDQGLWLTRSESYYDSMACTPSTKGYLAPAYSQPDTGPGQAEAPDALYNPQHSITITQTCQ